MTVHVEWLGNTAQHYFGHSLKREGEGWWFVSNSVLPVITFQKVSKTTVVGKKSTYDPFLN